MVCYLESDEDDAIYWVKHLCGCGTVGKEIAIASDARVPIFESSHWRNLLTVNCIKIANTKRMGMDQCKYWYDLISFYLKSVFTFKMADN